eukprot:TCONS_00031207-protein
MIIYRKLVRAPLIYIKRYYASDTKQKLLRVGVIGMPNSGKSSLINCIIQQKISAVSHIPHTTRISCDGVYNIDDTQLIFTDTPGVVSYREGHRLNLSKAHIRTPRRLDGSIDIAAVMVDVNHKKTRNFIDSNILDIIHNLEPLPCILIMNKVDLVKRKEDLLSITTLLTEDRLKDEWGYKPYGGYKKFKECFFTCAKTGEGIDPLMDYLISKAKPERWIYSEDAITDLSMEFQISEVFREKLLVLFGQEIPWQVQQETILLQEDQDGCIHVHQQLQWPKKSQCRYVESKFELLHNESMRELEGLLGCNVNLNLMIKNKKRMLRNDYG